MFSNFLAAISFKADSFTGYLSNLGKALLRDGEDLARDAYEFGQRIFGVGKDATLRMIDTAINTVIEQVIPQLGDVVVRFLILTINERFEHYRYRGYGGEYANAER